MPLSEEDLAKAKAQVKEALDVLGIAHVTNLAEVESELRRVEMLYESPLLLGIVARAMQDQSERAMAAFLPGVTVWKNFLPRTDLDGLSPAEYEKKYPRGQNELYIIQDLMQSYEARLRTLRNADEDSFDLQKDFKTFQEEFFSLVPEVQPFRDASHMLTNRDVIVEERKRRGHPAEKLNDISVAVFADNLAEKTGFEIARMDDTYMTRMDELVHMQNNHSARNETSIQQIYKDFEAIEPFMKCSVNSFRFYNNFANVALLANKEKAAIALLEKSLVINPHYGEGRRSLERLRALLELD
ncbi:MAG: hypothetical protein HY470_01625 [Candidatus Ryanbacteria bacterium]|nr:hypothetical protein [Candidatus Ryanbacteria bacterium]